MVDYDGRLSSVYAEGRRVSGETVRSWMNAFAGLAPKQRPLGVVDLGSGVGRFTPALAEAFGGPVYGVEPSARMRGTAEANATHDRVTYLDGAAEAIPLPDQACDVVVMFLSFHHFPDQQRGLREVFRVLRPGGVALLRTQFRDVMPDLFWYAYFPSGRAVDAGMYRTLAETKALAKNAGLEPDDEPVWVDADEPRTLRAAYERLRHRALSTFEHLPEDEIERGLAEFARDAADRPDEPVPSYPGAVLRLTRPSAP
ncbi:ubiquinone/menaquinone biosynthesis C-methylase UbiE [Kribbella amoyensis]|uniref:Ubiquinone/menaquinone biosynthesis C-methylase UbiE n=1 Tax=Kribbella amoyensis TaxID=996641 RepID=A0A561BY39_9ACTN|nr:class I SAM-dependent methyltransferase [Kribbella amoyensis]TWD83642.1 ubiquinone/menaquinone biosynthesis C-methylase UbiE [Kribbella amoyensis]